MLRRAAGMLAQRSNLTAAMAVAGGRQTCRSARCACAACALSTDSWLPSPLGRTFSAEPATGDEDPYYNLPRGHVGSDLSSVTCNIGLNRRRDLSLRQDLTLSTLDGEARNITEWLRGKNLVVFGIPNGGKVCVTEHIPGYEKLCDELKKCGIDGVLCVMVGQPAEVKAVADKVAVKKISFAADTNGGFTRLLGLDLAEPTAAGARSQRYAGVVENGILTKLKVEKELGKVDESGCATILELLQCKREQKLKAKA
eukprot:CAMPEP_0177795516 /NCGR_PEP_ID=MMETSP0491_2-20121128/26276_1 /TAXON_ID=63592 /ORGANISM="Tetraselmis chuii, Strain PLY429" /LENGTH=254 /DNA_ID=CAMNT_0019318355 /DNA_START=196 /DNA_END=956 /DNA_ORIENTATION=-